MATILGIAFFLTLAMNSNLMMGRDDNNIGPHLEITSTVSTTRLNVTTISPYLTMADNSSSTTTSRPQIRRQVSNIRREPHGDVLDGSLLFRFDPDLGLLDATRRMKLFPHVLTGERFSQLTREYLVTLATQVREICILFHYLD